jgi:hypothetical protein
VPRSVQLAAERLPFVYRHARSLWEAYSRWRQFVPPDAPYLSTRAKHETLRGEARRYGLRTLVETGTALGETVHALRHDFDAIVSIEIDPELHRRAVARFRTRRNISLYCADSGEGLGDVVANLDEPALFWLDSHVQRPESVQAARPTPIASELRTILAAGLDGHVILVDDARLLTGRGGWPSLDELRALVVELAPDAVFEVRNDIVRMRAARE